MVQPLASATARFAMDPPARNDTTVVLCPPAGSGAWSRRPWAVDPLEGGYSSALLAGEPMTTTLGERLPGGGQGEALLASARARVQARV